MIEKNSYPIPPIFHMLQSDGDVSEEMMYNTFNMGIGMMIVVAKEDVEKAMEQIRQAGEVPHIIGSIRTGEKGVTLC